VGHSRLDDKGQAVANSSGYSRNW